MSYIINCGLEQIIKKLLVPEKKKNLPELNAVLFIDVKNQSFVVYGHITLKTPVLVRSPKLSNVEPG